MEADILRLILLLVGATLVFGIYAFDLYKRKKQNQSSQNPMNNAQEHPVTEHIEPSWNGFYERDEEQERDESQEDRYKVVEPLVDDAISKNLDENITSELEQLEEILHEEHGHDHAKDRIIPSEQMSISFLTGEITKKNKHEQELSLPAKIIQLNIVSHDHESEFYGDDILCVASEVGMELGDMDIFHHYGDNPEQQQVIYSMASMVEPGVFPIAEMDNFSTPGLTIFARLPGPKDGLSIFADMLYTAEQLANLLDGELRDETHSALSKQTISHIREEIQEHHRQLQLARSKI